MRKVQIYIENQIIDLFQDENIEITSSVQNISDISKVFTDFSQSFTIPASKRNNAIFQHYYNNDVDGTFDAQVRVDARIEINYIPFRKGQIQLESSEIIKGKAESYTISFFGDVVTLKDLFGDDKLADLDYSSIQSAYTGANIQATIEGTGDLDVRYPLISSEKVWTYGDAGANDISLIGNPIDYTELFPAIKDSKIFSLIESKYGVDFVGNFLTDVKFDNMYTYWKNRATQDFISEPTDVVFTGGTVLDSSVANINFIDVWSLTQPAGFAFWTNTETQYLSIYINPSVNNVAYYIDCYKNNSLDHTVNVTGGAYLHHVLGVNGISNTNGLNDDWTFKVRAASVMDYTADLIWDFSAEFINTSTITEYYTDSEQVISGLLSINAYYDFAGTAPDMKISDYFSATLSQFNATCHPNVETDLEFHIETLNAWYKGGDKIDITPYVDIDKIKVSRPKLYNEITFSYKESKSFMNEAYRDFYNKNYGDLKELLGYDGGKYEVKLPFENLLFNRFTGEDLQVGYCLTRSPDYKPYVPNVIKLYLQENTTGVSFYFDDGTGASLIINYMPFGQDVIDNTSNFSMNWGNESSSLLSENVSNSLYKTYYQKYLVNLFNTKTRVVNLKCILPLSILSTLSLDDKLIVRDKEHIINTMKTNLTTGLVDLELLSDFTGGRITQPLPTTNCGAHTMIVPLKPVKALKGGLGGYIIIDSVLESSVFITTSVDPLPFTLTSETTIEVYVPANATGSPRTNTIPIEYYSVLGTLLYTEYIVVNQDACESFILAEDGTILMTEALENLLTE